MRTATYNDLHRIVEIYNSTIPSRIATADLTAVTVEDRRNWFESHSETRPIVVEEVDGEIAGWMSFESFYGRPAYHLTAEVSLYVDARFRGQGLGKRMLSEGIAKAPGFGLKNLVAFIFSHNLASMKLFEGQGFKCWGQLPKVAEMDEKLYDLSILGLNID